IGRTTQSGHCAREGPLPPARQAPTLCAYLAFHAQGALNLNHAAEQHRAAVCDFTNGKENMALNELSKAIAFEEVQRTFEIDRKSTRLNSSHLVISYAVFCLK